VYPIVDSGVTITYTTLYSERIKSLMAAVVHVITSHTERPAAYEADYGRYKLDN